MSGEDIIEHHLFVRCPLCNRLELRRFLPSHLSAHGEQVTPEELFSQSDAVVRKMRDKPRR